MAIMLPGTLLFATPKCRDCGMLSDSECTYVGEDFVSQFCKPCRDVMDNTVEEIAEELLADPKMRKAYQDQTEEEFYQEVLLLAEDLYFFEQDEPDEGN